MDLKAKDLVDWLRRRSKDEFPARRHYICRYNQVAEFLANEVHPHVATGAALVDGDFLNDHGPEHIATVIHRATEMVLAKACSLSAYEVYLLLAAIQVHDIGNIFGRERHEGRPARVQGRLETLLGDDTIEKRLIYTIAEAHGGSVNGERDTIVHLQPDQAVLGKQVRPRLLAALLRFADELADDRTRAARFAVDHGVVPEAGRIFHKYSEALHSVVIDRQGRAVDLQFHVPEADARRLFPKADQQVYLLDEITSRTVKMHRERIYCTRFMRPAINFESINVKISVYAAPRPERYAEQLVEIGYRLEDRGYPDPQVSLYDLCPNLRAWHNGAPLSGGTLVARLEERGNRP